MSVRHSPLASTLRSRAHVLSETPRDYDALVALVGGRSFVLLGEATHGTHEFYRMRAEITRRLIEEHNFDAVALEADWPDTYEIHRHVLGLDSRKLDDVLASYQRFPTWMWRNAEFRAFVEWLKLHNTSAAPQSRVGVYGLDLYSLYRSADAVIAYLDQVDPDQAAAARRLYTCLDHVRDPQEYGYAAEAGLRPACREAAAKLLIELVRKAPEYQLAHVIDLRRTV